MGATTQRVEIERITESGEHPIVGGMSAAAIGLMMLAASAVLADVPEGEQRDRAQRRLRQSERARFADRRLEAMLDEVDLERVSAAAPYVAVCRALAPLAPHAGGMRAAIAIAERAFMGAISAAELGRVIDQFWPADTSTPASRFVRWAEHILRSGLDVHVRDSFAMFVVHTAEALPDHAVELLDEVPDRFAEELARISVGAFEACAMCGAPHVASCTCSPADRARRRFDEAVRGREDERARLRELAADRVRASMETRHGVPATSSGWKRVRDVVRSLDDYSSDDRPQAAEDLLRLKGLDLEFGRAIERLSRRAGPIATSRALVVALAAVAEHERDEEERACAETVMLRTLDWLALASMVDADEAIRAPWTADLESELGLVDEQPHGELVEAAVVLARIVLGGCVGGRLYGEWVIRPAARLARTAKDSRWIATLALDAASDCYSAIADAENEGAADLRALLLGLDSRQTDVPLAAE